MVVFNGSIVFFFIKLSQTNKIWKDTKISMSLNVNINLKNCKFQFFQDTSGTTENDLVLKVPYRGCIRAQPLLGLNFLYLAQMTNNV